MGSLLKEFENVLEVYQESTAVAYWDEANKYSTMSYKEVAEICENISGFIRDTVKEKHTCLGLLMEHNYLIAPLVISLQRCSLSFIFLDPHVPDTNLSIIKKLGLTWIVSLNHENSNNFLRKISTKEINFEKTEALTLWQITDSKSTHSFKDICFVICTSGTTGDPKVVKVQERCIMSNIVSLRKKFEITQEDVIYFGTPLTFDPSIVELFLALVSGSTLLIVPPKIKINPSRLLNALFPKDDSYKGATVLQIVPSLFLHWRSSDIQYIFHSTSCRILAFGGEKFPEVVLNYKKSDSLRLFNLYGITEVSCWASVHEVKDWEVSLGEPLDDTILEVRNDKGEKIDKGEGELFIGSSSRICYINEENESTISKPVFRSTGDKVKIRKNELFYICRQNTTVKRLGQRIDLIEIEEKVFDITGFVTGCIWVENKSKLVLFIAFPEFNPITKHKIVDKFRVKILHHLPKQCFPDHIEMIPNFPLTAHGKIDRKSLEYFYNNSSSKSQFKNCVDVFNFLLCKYLGLSLKDTIKHYQSNFFELGGNSISAIQLIAEFREMTQVDYPTELTTLLFEKSLQECCDLLKNTKAVPLKKRQHDWEESDKSKIRKLEENYTEEENSVKLKISWSYDMKACVDSSPTIIENGTATLIGVGSFAQIFAVVDSTSGNEISKIVLPDTIESACCASPSQPHVYQGCYNSKMYCIDYTSGKIVWEYNTGDCIKSTPCLCLHNQGIVFGCYDKSIHCISVKNGSVIWKTFVSESIISNPISYQNKIYFATTFGTCFCVSEKNGKVVWKCNVGAPIFGSPCIDEFNETILWPDVSGSVHCFSCENGVKNWSYKANGGIYSSLTKYKDFIIFGCHDHMIYCLQINKNACILQYKIKLNSAVNSTPQVIEYKENKYIVAVANQGNVYMIEFSSGNVMDNLQLPGEVFSTPAIKNNNIYVGCRDNNIYCLTFVTNTIT